MSDGLSERNGKKAQQQHDAPAKRTAAELATAGRSQEPELVDDLVAGWVGGAIGILAVRRNLG